MPVLSNQIAYCITTRYFRGGGNTGIVGRALLALAICAAATAASAGQLELRLADAEGRAKFIRPVAVGDRFTIAFLHSYAKSPVEEVFEVIGPGEFRLRETFYADFGAGLPHEPGAGQRMEFGGGRIRITGYDMKFEVLHVRVGRVANHTIRVGGEEVRLDSLFAPGSGVAVRVAEAE